MPNAVGINYEWIMKVEWPNMKQAISNLHKNKLLQNCNKKVILWIDRVGWDTW
jgi:hypothetical protein